MPDEPTCRQTTLDTIGRETRAWRQAHPQASFTEIEQAMDARWREARAGLLAELAGADDAEARCPGCGERLVRRGTRARTVWTQGEQPVALTRSYATCPACGRGLFPPG